MTKGLDIVGHTRSGARALSAYHGGAVGGVCITTKISSVNLRLTYTCGTVDVEVLFGSSSMPREVLFLFHNIIQRYHMAVKISIQDDTACLSILFGI